MKLRWYDWLRYIVTVLWLASLAIAYTALNSPECPSHYTNAEVAAHHCIVGANIGLGLMKYLIIQPLGVLTGLLWFIWAIKQLRRLPASKHKTSS